MDYYDMAVEYLTNHPEDIYSAWESPASHIAGHLFDYCTTDRTYTEAGIICGCPSQVRAGKPSCRDDLTEAIRADQRLPRRISRWDAICGEITVEHLHVFAEWQRKLDTELGRTPPVWPEEVPT